MSVICTGVLYDALVVADNKTVSKNEAYKFLNQQTKVPFASTSMASQLEFGKKLVFEGGSCRKVGFNSYLLEMKGPEKSEATKSHTVEVRHLIGKGLKSDPTEA
jgi:predicted Zn-ribbon and HTH transcriptional regulator